MTDDQVTAFELSLPSELGYEKLVRHTVAWLGSQLHFDAARIADLQTALSEACINAIEHGNRRQPGRRVGVAFSVTSTHLEAVVADEGICRYRPSETCASIEQKLAGLAPERGMGLMLIGNLVDEAGFLPARRGRGNRYRMRMYRPQPAPEAAAA